MAINLVMCINSNCKNYYEDNCTKILDNTKITIGKNGKCETFEEGISEYYETPVQNNISKSGIL